MTSPIQATNASKDPIFSMPDHIDPWKSECAVAALQQQGLIDLLREKYPEEQNVSS